MKTKYVLIAGLLVTAVMFLGCGSRKPDPEVALELVNVMFYGVRPTMHLAVVQRSGLQVEDYLPMIRRYSPIGDTVQIRMVYAHALMDWGMTKDAWELLEREPRGLDARGKEDLWDLRFGVSLLTGKSLPMAKAGTSMEPTLESKAVEALYDGDAAQALGKFSKYLSQSGWNRHTLDQATVLLRASTKYAKGSSHFEAQRDLSDKIYTYILKGREWPVFYRMLMDDKGPVDDTINFRNLVWVLASRTQVEKLAKRDESASEWNQKTQDLIAFLEQRGDRRAKWIEYVRSELWIRQRTSG